MMSEDSEGKRIVIVEDDALISALFSEYCRIGGHEVVGVASEPGSAERIIAETQPDFVLMDVRLNAERDGVDVALQAAETAPNAKIVYVTGSNEPATLARINDDNPHRILIKPVLAEALHAALA
jgi:CheY-like chemotaxis protein